MIFAYFCRDLPAPWSDLGTAKQYIDWLVYRPDLSKHGLWGEKALELHSKKNGGYWNWHVALRNSHTLSKLLFSCAVFLRCKSCFLRCCRLRCGGFWGNHHNDGGRLRHCALLLRCCAPLLCHGGATGRAPIARDCTASWCPSWRWQRLGIVGIVKKKCVKVEDMPRFFGDFWRCLDFFHETINVSLEDIGTLWMKPQVLWSLQGYSPLSVAKKARELGVGHKFVLVKESLKKYLVNLVCNIPSGKLT